MAKDIYMYALGALLVFAFFVLLYLLLFNPIPAENNEVIYLAVGALIGHVATVVGYFFGSSAGSAKKTDLLANGKEK